MEIVIGYQGKNHVTAGQVGRIMAGMAGSGTYVLETQNRLAATVVTANQVRVDTGDLVMQGRVATVETPETLTIESGVTGQKRRDLIVARYTMEDSTAVEGIELAVVKGTPVSYGEPSDPEVSEGSILDGDSPVEVPLYRVTVDGLTPGTPEALLDTVPSVDSLRDSVSRTLWTGSFGSGSITVPGLSDYHLVIVEGRTRAMLCVVGPNYLCGVMGLTTATAGQVRLMGLSFNRSGDRLSYGTGFDVVDCRGNAGDVTTVDSRIPVTRIIGLI